MTKTSAYGPNVLIPVIKSSEESAGDVLFFPRLMARTVPGRNEPVDDSPMSWKVGIRLRKRDTTAVAPSELKPYRFISAASAERRKTRGRGFPGCQAISEQ